MSRLLPGNSFLQAAEGLIPRDVEVYLHNIGYLRSLLLKYVGTNFLIVFRLRLRNPSWILYGRASSRPKIIVLSLSNDRYIP